jgi:hypothetical protein
MLMMKMKFTTSILAAVLAACMMPAANAAIIAGWDQNSNANPLAPDGFGLTPADFPQANDHGPASATHSINAINPSVDGNGIYTNVDSFSGTLDNDLAPTGVAGGSFSFIGDTSNGSQSIFSVPTTNYEDINVSWSQRGTGTGFNSRVFEYSSDGGANWTDIGAFNHTDATAASAGALGSTFKTVSLDFSSVSALEDNPNVMFRITYNGASSGSGNNRWDNFYVQGTFVPEPTSAVLMCLAGFGILGFTRRK